MLLREEVIIRLFTIYGCVDLSYDSSDVMINDYDKIVRGLKHEEGTYLIRQPEKGGQLGYFMRRIYARRDRGGQRSRKNPCYGKENCALHRLLFL